MRLVLTLTASSLLAIGCLGSGDNPNKQGTDFGRTPSPPSATDMASSTPPAADMTTPAPPTGNSDMAMTPPTGSGDMAMSGGGGDPNAPYPSGPYGTDEGGIVDGSFSWECLKPGESSLTTVSVKDFYDPAGAKKINALLLDSSFIGCHACEDEGKAEEGEWDKSWKDNGVVAVTLLRSGDEPSDWVKMFSLKHIYVCKDPNNVMKASGYPKNAMIDPRKMKIEKVIPGYGDGALDPLLDIAKRNKK